ncbi:hypothetical protein D8B26_002250 [Coccidioides posadasii str. Silveira]|uniref:Uncharacterized protein n=2 Tax=Coccidioides posadasii TaxID=199306 RepID=E9DDD8_COCPS|nr:conserved hypothetical protein [Coccidioides posadasii str. Silveira]KMM65648.1 hypothetical protein CPAG_01994 [Coccidioides posadasii RMSCC 3488]QVM07552.1 hypothetical protein D8B26_002250 [Coccidioides posadasii str. Silveira]
MDSHALLDQADEDSLHKSRLLNVEEKPFKRITKRLLTPNNLISSPTAFLPTPPPDSTSPDDDALARYEAERQKLLEDWRQFQEDVTLDFAAFEGSIARIQFLLSSNAKERERYAAEKLRILATAQEVKENTAELRKQLEEAQKTLALRKTYDELAEKITSNRLLRPREDQQANLEKLNAEIAKLEKESGEYAQTWAERREQFGRIVEEGMNLRRLIRDEKEEVERREGMEEGEEGDEGEVASKGRVSMVGTPRPDQDTMTPSQSMEDVVTASGKPHPEKLKSSATPGITPLRQGITISRTDDRKESEDENMEDEGEVSGDESGNRGENSAIEGRSPSKTADDLEEGEEISDDKLEDKMDTT